MSKSRKKMDLWNWVSVLLLLLFLIFFIYPCVRLWEAFYTEEAGFTLDAFVKFFSKSYYFSTILNSFKVSIAVMALAMVLGVPFSYFFTFYRLKGRRVLFVLALLCTMSAPFIGAYSWILLLGRSGPLVWAKAGIHTVLILHHRTTPRFPKNGLFSSGNIVPH